MEAKLIKDKHIDNFYYLMVGINTYATTHKESFRVLSLKNCQAIELGYDLDELAEEWVDVNSHKWSNNNNEVGDNYGSFKSGFQKALELNSTKLFTLEDMMNCWNKALTFQNHKETLGEHLATLQQTEWDVIILEEPIDLAFYENGNRFPIDANLPDRFKYKPLLDADGCIILKRK